MTTFLEESFLGSLTRDHERAGLAIFDVESGNARKLAILSREMQRLFLEMIAWYIKRMDSSMHPTELWNEFISELRRSESSPQQD